MVRVIERLVPLRQYAWIRIACKLGYCVHILCAYLAAQRLHLCVKRPLVPLVQIVELLWSERLASYSACVWIRIAFKLNCVMSCRCWRRSGFAQAQMVRLNCTSVPVLDASLRDDIRKVVAPDLV